MDDFLEFVLDIFCDVIEVLFERRKIKKKRKKDKKDDVLK